MIVITNTDLEEIISGIEDQEKRLRISIKLFEKKDKDKTAEFARQYASQIINGEIADNLDGYSQKTFSMMELLRLVPKEKAKELGEEYIKTQLKILENDNTENRREKAGRICEIAREYKLIDQVKPHVECVVEGLVQKLSRPKKINDLRDFEEYSTFNSFFKLNNPEAELLLLGKKLIEPSWHEDKNPEDKKAQAIEVAYNLARSIFDNSGSVTGLDRIVFNPDFIKKYSDDEKAKKIAQSTMISELIRGYFDNALKLAMNYNIEHTREFAREALSKSLSQGSYDLCDRIKKDYGIEFRLEDLDKKRNSLEEDYKTRLKSLDIKEIIRAKQRIKSLEAYLNQGLDISTVPETILPQDYHGKFLLIEYKGRTFFRVFEGIPDERDDMHKDIDNSFNENMNILGFSDYSNPSGGGYVGFDKDGSIVLSGSSGDFGECDKDLAKEMVQRLYPDRKVITKSEKGRDW